jgi:hypothetical protein
MKLPPSSSPPLETRAAANNHAIKHQPQPDHQVPVRQYTAAPILVTREPGMREPVRPHSPPRLCDLSGLSRLERLRTQPSGCSSSYGLAPALCFNSTSSATYHELAVGDSCHAAFVSSAHL